MTDSNEFPTDPDLEKHTRRRFAVDEKKMRPLAASGRGPMATKWTDCGMAVTFTILRTRICFECFPMRVSRASKVEGW